MEEYDSSTQQPEKAERIQGIQSGELFVRLNGAKLFEPGGTLHGAHPFLKKVLHIQDGDTSAVDWLMQPSEAKLAFTNQLRRQTRQRKCTVKRRWDAVQKAVEVFDVGSLDGKPTHLSSITNPASNALDRYLQLFHRLEQAYKQHVTSDILHLYALLEAESRYVTAWSNREETACSDQRALTKLLHQFNSFALQLESETSGQVRMWRLPSSDAQRIRCVKAATENIKKRFFPSSTQSLEVLEVYKIENKVLLNAFQSYAGSLSKTSSEIKIKGLFCSVPPECVERCVVYGMHSTKDKENGEPCFVDTQGTPVKVFNRSTLLQGREDAPGTNMMFRARSKVNNGLSLQFPRRFSRYSTLEELRPSMSIEPYQEDQSSNVQYLGLCRVAMGKTLRVKDNCASFPDDLSVGALHFINEVCKANYCD
ncbi:Hypothetical protein PHPALM_36175 [Phytophthora palmivora]|uniref:Uncharacterized protein n=1 Tax=Phytophthora palmivora TaxID=4796 RepID=A0A2P4X0M3_9STRA|nr:Hypothetical protein PHPALM_36175 [Phytophthora palmivora]